MYTLADFLKNPPVSGIQPLNMRGDYHTIPIESVSVQELPVDNFIKKNELVLSTALGCLNDDARFRQLLFEVSQAEAAAMLLSFPDDAYCLSDELIQYANDLALPIFIIPWKYRFSEIQSEVIHSIQDEKLRVYRDIQTNLFNLYFDTRPLDCAAELVASYLSATAVIEDRNHQICSSSEAVKERSPALLGEKQWKFYQFEIVVGQTLFGYLRLSAPALEEHRLPSKSEEENAVRKYICFPLSLWFNQKNIEDMVTARLKNDFVWNLANKNYDSFKEFALHGMRLHFNLEKNYSCLILKAVSEEANATNFEYSSKAARDSAEIESIIIEVSRKLKLDVMFADRSLQFIIYLENVSGAAEEMLERFVDETETRLGSMFPKTNFFWGISEVVQKKEEYVDFNRLYNNACLALQYCLNANERRHRFTYQDTKEAQVISALSNHLEIRRAAEETLAPLLENVSGKELMHTLTEYIACNYNSSLTARRLHLHRQSLLYRISKIEALTNMDLTQHRDLFLLEIYSRIFSNY